LWLTGNTGNFVTAVLENTGLWGSSLAVLPGFSAAVTDCLETIQQQGMVAAVQKIQVQQTS
jgi:mannitol-1-phosphate/altronate dehydrogenase